MNDIVIEALVAFVTAPDAQERLDAGFFVCTNCGQVVHRTHCHFPCNGGSSTDAAIESAKRRMHEKYAHKRFTVTEEEGGHCWGIMQGSVLTIGKHESCLYCMAMRPTDKRSIPCEPRKITLRGGQ